MTRASSGDSAAKRPVAADLAGASVLVAGAGLAGLTAACDLAAMGAAVTVIEARDLDHALALAKLVPIVRGGVEVRPLLGFEVLS